MSRVSLAKMLLSLIACAFLLTGCAVQPEGNKNSGPDSVKQGAQEAPLGRLNKGSIDRNGGDMTDWRYVRIPGSGVIEITLTFDNHSAGGVMVIRNSGGIHLARLEDRGQPILSATFRGEPGIYYLEIFSQSGRSDYTFEVVFDSLY